MTLTKAREELLRARFSVWGLENVRKELGQSANASLVPPDVAAFTRAWVWQQDAKRDRRARLIRVFAVILLALLVGAVVAALAA